MLHTAFFSSTRYCWCDAKISGRRIKKKTTDPPRTTEQAIRNANYRRYALIPSIFRTYDYALRISRC